MSEDKLVIGLNGIKLAINTSEVAGIVAVQHPTYLPNQSGFVSGVISLRGEPVTVVDVRKAFNLQSSPVARHLVIVVTDAKRTLGLDTGEAETSFLWTEDLKQSLHSGNGEKYSKGVITLDTNNYIIVDWRAMFDEAVRLLQTDETHG